MLQHDLVCMQHHIQTQQSEPQENISHTFTKTCRICHAQSCDNSPRVTCADIVPRQSCLFVFHLIFSIKCAFLHSFSLSVKENNMIRILITNDIMIGISNPDIFGLIITTTL